MTDDTNVKRADASEARLQITKVFLWAFPSRNGPRFDRRVENFEMPDQRQLTRIERKQENQDQLD